MTQQLVRARIPSVSVTGAAIDLEKRVAGRPLRRLDGLGCDRSAAEAGVQDHPGAVEDSWQRLTVLGEAVHDGSGHRIAADVRSRGASVAAIEQTGPVGIDGPPDMERHQPPAALRDQLRERGAFEEGVDLGELS